MILQAMCTSFKAELPLAIHDITTDVIKMALYTSNADLSAATAAYTTTEEIVGTGYVAGGITLTGGAVTASGTSALLTFDSPEWNPAAFTTRGALIYNSSKANRAVAVLDFGADKTPALTFTVVVPVVSTDTALLRIA